MKKGGMHQNHTGKYLHNDIMGKESFGTKVFSKGKHFGWINVLRPNSHLYTSNLMQRTQILYTPDISMVISRLSLK